MVTTSQLLNQAQVILRDGLGLRANEELLILQDGTVSSELAEASSCAAVALGARPVQMSFQSTGHLPMREYGLFADASLQRSRPTFPGAVIQAISGSDRLLLAVSDMRVLFFGSEFRDATAPRPFMGLTYLTAEAALRLLPESGEEVRELAEQTQEVANMLAKARRARITSPAGTDIALSLGQYERVWIDDGIARAGRFAGQPAGQVSRIPDDGSAEGQLVINRSIGANNYRELVEPVHITVQKGRAVSISGGAEADQLRRFLANMSDPSIYHLTELGIGTNPRCRFTGVAAPAEDTHTAGCVSLALGCDVHLGGSVRAGAHVDMTMRFPSLELDGKEVVSEGILLGASRNVP